jgi:competence protein ComEA
MSMGDIDRRWLVVAVVGLLITFGLGSFYGSYRERQNNAEEITLLQAEMIPAEREDLQESQDQEIIVFVTGEVEKPNIYRFTSGARIYEALEKAVPKPTADLRYIDMARLMVDEETILVPVQGESPEAESMFTAPPSGISASGKININRASVAELDQHLNGIGPTLAQRIIDYREENGPFRSIEDLRNVSGIGDKRFADLKDQVDVK